MRSPAHSFAGLLKAWACLAVALGVSAINAHAGLAERVVILANALDPDSVRLAAYYADKRGIPPANIIALPLSAQETITWPEFVPTLWQPLQDELVHRHWIEATASEPADELGRRKYLITGHKIAYLVVCRGVPLRIEHTPAFLHEKPTEKMRSELLTNAAAVDSELSLLAEENTVVNGPVQNRLFGREHPGELELSHVVKVARLDGPTYEDARNLIDSGLAGEAQGLIGRYYVDQGGPHPDGDHWLGSVRTQLDEIGFDGDTESTNATLADEARFDRPVLYFGWHTGTLNGPMALPGFRFPAGAIAIHIHSHSADTLRSASAGWCGPLVARGVAATVGNVYEPYLQFLHRPNYFIHGLIVGMNVGDAAYFSLPALSWQSILIGDPLYRPFAVSPAQQWSQLRKLPPTVAPYLILRRTRLLELAGKKEDVLPALRMGFQSYPGLVLGLALASRLEVAGDHAGAVAVIETASAARNPGTTDDPLLLEAARFLSGHEAAAKALPIYTRFLEHSPASGEHRLSLLREASTAARAAGDSARTQAWEKEAGPSPVSGTGTLDAK